MLAAGWLAVGQSLAAVRLDLDRARITEGETVTLGDFAGKRVVLFFYPRDNTSG